jgi:hypothetical protein
MTLRSTYQFSPVKPLGSPVLESAGMNSLPQRHMLKRLFVQLRSFLDMPLNI